MVVNNANIYPFNISHFVLLLYSIKRKRKTKICLVPFLSVKIMTCASLTKHKDKSVGPRALASSVHWDFDEFMDNLPVSYEVSRYYEPRRLDFGTFSGSEGSRGTLTVVQTPTPSTISKCTG